MSELCSGYRTIRGSDIHRDGMYLELIDCESGDEVAEVFYSDQNQKMQISIFRQDMPLDVIERFIERAKRDLPATAHEPKA